MAIDTQPVLATCFAGGTNGSAITAPATPGYQSLGTADGMYFDTVTTGTGQAQTYDTTAVSGLTMRKIVTTTGNSCFGQWTSAGLLTNAAAQQWTPARRSPCSSPAGMPSTRSRRSAALTCSRSTRGTFPLAA